MSQQGDMSSSYSQLSTAGFEILSRIAELGVKLTSHSERAESLQHVTEFWSVHAQLVNRLKANSCNVAVLGLAKSGDALNAPLPCARSLSHVLTYLTILSCVWQARAPS